MDDVELRFALLFVVLVAQSLHSLRLASLVKGVQVSRAEVFGVNTEHAAVGAGVLDNLVSSEHNCEYSLTLTPLSEVSRAKSRHNSEIIFVI